jgi:hypothetical protein
MFVRASHGGIQANPCFSELRMHGQTAIQLWNALALPELDEDGAQLICQRPGQRPQGG